MSQLVRQFIAYPKPKDAPKREKPAIHIMPDGREICARGTDSRGQAGQAEYKRRVKLMWERQEGICCLYGFLEECHGKLDLRDATFEHEHGRTSGKRDDRIVLPDGRWINGAAHSTCNFLKGSRKIPYNEFNSKTS